MNCTKALKDQADQLFSKRGPLLSLWQEIADNFAPMRADFTTCRNVGEELSKNLLTSYPVLACRDLGNAFGAMLRPSAKQWFKIATDKPDKEDTRAKQWLEKSTILTKNVMYAKDSGFTRAVKEADHDFAAFGQAALSIEMNKRRDGILYRCWHLRDVAA